MCFAFNNFIYNKKIKFDDLESIYEETEELQKHFNDNYTNLQKHNSELETEKTKLNNLIQEYNMILEKTPEINLTYPYIYNNTDNYVIYKRLIKLERYINNSLSTINKIKGDIQKMKTDIAPTENDLYNHYNFNKKLSDVDNFLIQKKPKWILQEGGNNYEKKYMKYKTKYLQLKNKIN